MRHQRTIEIIPESQLFRERYVTVRDRRREVAMPASLLAKQNARHALKVCDRATHWSSYCVYGLETGVRAYPD